VEYEVHSREERGHALKAAETTWLWWSDGSVPVAISMHVVHQKDNDKHELVSGRVLSHSRVNFATAILVTADLTCV
jgi:hypothetical protein